MLKNYSRTKLLRVDYVSHPMGKIYKHKYEAWEKPEGDIDLLTSYVKDYPGENVSCTLNKWLTDINTSMKILKFRASDSRLIMVEA